MKKTTLILTITATIIFSSSSIVSGASTQDTMDLYNSVADISSEKSCQTKYYESLKDAPPGATVAKEKGTECKVVPHSVFLNHLIYKIVKSPDTGRYWLDRNLGATEVCLDADGDGIAGDGDEACYGDLYQWGRSADGHEVRANNTILTDTLATDITNAGSMPIKSFRGSDWASVDSDGALRTAAWKDGGSNDICPPGFSVPTTPELKADSVHDEYLTYTGTNDITGTRTAFSNFLKLPVAGDRGSFYGALLHVGVRGNYWSRTGASLYFSDALYSEGFSHIYDKNIHLYRAELYSVRCIMDE